MTLQVGYAQTIITPSLARPVYLAGFGQNRLARSVHDQLYVRVLALHDGDAPLVLVALDLLGLNRPHCLEIERRVTEHVPHVRVILACTHTHHGPDTIGLWGPDPTTRGVDEMYLAELKDQVVQTVLAALESLRPSRLQKAAATRVPGVVKNTRDPLVIDDELTAVQFLAGDDMPLATLMIFACHPEVLWEGTPHITSDYVFILRRRIELATGAPCVFVVGTLGGMMTPDVKDHSFAEAEAMGETLAKAGLEALRQDCFVSRTNDGGYALGKARQEYSVPMANPVFMLAMRAGLLPHTLNADNAVLTEINLLRLGPVWLVTVPGEVSPKLGLEIKQRLKERGAQISAVIGLANDELGYILPQEDFVYPDDPFNPGEHYEETMSVGPEAGPTLMDAVRELLINEGVNGVATHERERN
jgi:hypothetical protein